MTMTMQTEPAAPLLHRVMTIRVRIAAPELLGESAEGMRSNYRILGGCFDGPDLSGQVLGHGADFYLQRADGTGELDARYSLLTGQGELINVHNTGLLTLSDAGRQLEARGVWPVPEQDYRCTCTPRFQVAQGRLQWLAKTSFIGRVMYPGADEVVIHCYRLA